MLSRRLVHSVMFILDGFLISLLANSLSVFFPKKSLTPGTFRGEPSDSRWGVMRTMERDDINYSVLIIQGVHI